eukprot:5933413-Heterocapsa_arctica.AAC.1
MNFDLDGSAYDKYREQAIDKKEWGGFEQIVMWSRIYCLKIEIYSYGIDMQTVNGDDFMLDKECIILLYCNK